MLLVSSVIIAISNGNGWGWASEGMLILFGGVLVLAWAFVWWERRQSVPFLPVAVFRLSAVSSGLFISFTSFVLANLVLVVLPFYLLDQVHESPLTAGYMMTAYPLLLALTGPFSGWASDRYRARPLIFAGLGAMGAGMTVLAIWLEALSAVEIIAVLALVGAGMGLIASPNNSYIMRHVPIEHAGAIGGMIALTRNAGWWSAQRWDWA
ncbi:MFS transporter [Brevibacillus brevis]